MSQQKFRPTNLRTLLSVILVVVILGGIALYYFNLIAIREYAHEVNQRIADANASSKQVSNLQALKSQLTQNSSLIDKANQLFSTPESYQSQTLTDVKRYADAAGLPLTSTSFAETGSTIVIAFKNPVTYTKLIAFLNNIESNLPKLHVSSLGIAPSDTASATTVKVNDIKINVSIR
jgi:predicted PurR-regulated permease PerM